MAQLLVGADGVVLGHTGISSSLDREIIDLLKMTALLPVHSVKKRIHAKSQCVGIQTEWVRPLIHVVESLLYLAQRQGQRREFRAIA